MASSIFPTAAAAAFGIGAAESGMLLQSHSVKLSSQKKEQMSNDGEYALVAFYGHRAEITFEGMTTGAPSFTVGAAPTIANRTKGNGIGDTGILICTQGELSVSNEDLQKVSVQASFFATN